MISSFPLYLGMLLVYSISLNADSGRELMDITIECPFHSIPICNFPAIIHNEQKWFYSNKNHNLYLSQSNSTLFPSQPNATNNHSWEANRPEGEVGEVTKNTNFNNSSIFSGSSNVEMAKQAIIDNIYSVIHFRILSGFTNEYEIFFYSNSSLIIPYIYANNKIGDVFLQKNSALSKSIILLEREIPFDFYIYFNLSSNLSEILFPAIIEFTLIDPRNKLNTKFQFLKKFDIDNLRIKELNGIFMYSDRKIELIKDGLIVSNFSDPPDYDYFESDGPTTSLELNLSSGSNLISSISVISNNSDIGQVKLLESISHGIILSKEEDVIVKFLYECINKGVIKVSVTLFLLSQNKLNILWNLYCGKMQAFGLQVGSNSESANIVKDGNVLSPYKYGSKEFNDSISVDIEKDSINLYLKSTRSSRSLILNVPFISVDKSIMRPKLNGVPDNHNVRIIIDSSEKLISIKFNCIDNGNSTINITLSPMESLSSTISFKKYVADPELDK